MVSPLGVNFEADTAGGRLEDPTAECLEDESYCGVWSPMWGWLAVQQGRATFSIARRVARVGTTVHSAHRTNKARPQLGTSHSFSTCHNVQYVTGSRSTAGSNTSGAGQ
jgi:hypothetical protein